MALPEEEQRASWATLIRQWEANYQRELDTDFAFDHAPERLAMWEAGE